MLGEFFGWLVVAAETLSLDGILFHPNHYHVAAVSHRYARFLDPEGEATFQAIEEALAGMPLAEASRAVDGGSLSNADTGEAFQWRGWTMVLPASERLRRLTGGEGYERAVRDARGGVRLALAAAHQPLR
jgi:hypothetical protein